jgi:hypothetical protein
MTEMAGTATPRSLSLVLSANLHKIDGLSNFSTHFLPKESLLRAVRSEMACAGDCHCPQSDPRIIVVPTENWGSTMAAGYRSLSMRNKIN